MTLCGGSERIAARRNGTIESMFARLLRRVDAARRLHESIFESAAAISAGKFRGRSYRDDGRMMTT
jgi:hypothetical protein